MENLMLETEGVNLFDRMRPAYQKWAEPVSRVFAHAVLEHAKITQPSHLMAGSLDPAATLLADAFVNVDQHVTDLRGNMVLDGAGHWLPLERTTEVNAALRDFLRGLRT